MLRSGKYSIDWYDGDPREDGEMHQVYHLRPATIMSEGQVFVASWGGRCVMLGKAGCTLDRSERPTVCRALVPMESGCDGLTKHDVAMAWLADSEWLGALGIEIQMEQAE